MNFGHGELPLYACPTAKSAPLPENSTVFNVSAPMAFDASAMTVFASCADASDAKKQRITPARVSLFGIVASKSFERRMLARVPSDSMYEPRHVPLVSR